MKKYQFLLMIPLCLGMGSVSLASDTSEAHSKGEVSFKADESIINPDNPQVIDPSDPDGGYITPPDDSEGVGGDGTGAFRISWASHFKFGDVTLDGLDHTLFAKDVSFNGKEMAPFVQIVDNRGLVDSPWTLKAKAEPFVIDTKEGKRELKGASLILEEGKVMNSLTNDFSNSLPSGDLSKRVEITGQDQTVLTNEGDSGNGVWTLMFGAKGNDLKVSPDMGVKLIIPKNSGALVGKYTSDITWTLSAEPSQGGEEA